MKSRILVLAASLLVACQLSEPFPFPSESLRLYSPPMPLYTLWWEAVEACAGRTASLANVSWYVTQPGQLLVVRGDTLDGAWFADGNRIALFRGVGPVVRHEMLHAILRDGTHPAAMFAGRCSGYVVFDGADLYQVPAADTIRAPTLREDSVLTISVELYRPRSGLLAYDGNLLYVVKIENQGPAGWVDTADGVLAYVEDTILGLGGGFQVRSKRVFFRQGAVHTFLVDGQIPLYAVDEFRVQAGFARARSPVTVIRLN